MNNTEPTKKKNISFEVEIESGGRAYRESEAVRVQAPVMSAARAEAKAKARKRYLTIGLVTAGLVVLTVAWAWLTNPLANIPSDAVARVNGQFIYERDVLKRLSFAKFLDVLYARTMTDDPNATAMLEKIIVEKIELQDAAKSEFAVTQADIDRDLEEIGKSTGRTVAQIEELLSQTGLVTADLREYSATTLLIVKNRQRVTTGAKSESDAQNLLNNWYTQLIDAAKVERFKAAGPGPAPRVGAEAPDFALKDLEGGEVKLSSLRGKPVMINFWATWCVPCRDEIPVITQMYRETGGGEKYEVVGVATQSDLSTIRAFRDEFGMKFPLLADVSGGVISKYHVLPIPTTFFVDSGGIIRHIQPGPVTRAMMEQWLIAE